MSLFQEFILGASTKPRCSAERRFKIRNALCDICQFISLQNYDCDIYILGMAIKVKIYDATAP